MSKHTPGPWEVQGHVDIDNMPDFEVVAPRHADSGPYYFSVAQHMTREDAHLLAAAPELLEALVNVCELLGGDVPDSARAAIRKATEEA